MAGWLGFPPPATRGVTVINTRELTHIHRDVGAPLRALSRMLADYGEDDWRDRSDYLSRAPHE